MAIAIRLRERVIIDGVLIAATLLWVLYSYLLDTPENQLFARSGAIMCATAALLEARTQLRRWHFSQDNDDRMTNEFRALADNPDPAVIARVQAQAAAEAKLTAVNLTIRTIALVFLIAGTINWAYGDLILRGFS